MNQTLTALDVEREDILAQIKEREADARRHRLWAILGVSPGAAIPLLVSFDQIAPLALLVAVVAMVGFEFWRAHGAKRDVEALKVELQSLREVAPPGSREQLPSSTDPPPG